MRPCPRRLRTSTRPHMRAYALEGQMNARCGVCKNTHPAREDYQACSDAARVHKRTRAISALGQRYAPVGAIVRDAYWRETYTVLAHHEDGTISVDWHGNAQVANPTESRITRHRTPLGERDEILWKPWAVGAHKMALEANPWVELALTRQGRSAFIDARALPREDMVRPIVCPHQKLAWYRPSVGAYCVPDNDHRCLLNHAGTWVLSNGRTPEWDHA